jgi:hypothetical protein
LLARNFGPSLRGEKVGSAIAIRIRIIAMTISSSMRVKPWAAYGGRAERFDFMLVSFEREGFMPLSSGFFTLSWFPSHIETVGGKSIFRGL